MNLYNQTINWIKDRIKERTSWDGLVIIGVSLAIIVASPIIKYLALAGVAYGAWTFWKSE